MWSPSRLAKERIAKRRAGTGAIINMWPFVGILLALLIIMMCNTPPYHYHPFGLVDYPSSIYAAARPKAIREDSIRIALTRDGSIFFRGTKVSAEDLPDLIRKAVQEGSERRVYLAADARARYADVKAVIDCIGQAGIRDVTVLAEKVSPANTSH